MTGTLDVSTAAIYTTACRTEKRDHRRACWGENITGATTTDAGGISDRPLQRRQLGTQRRLLDHTLRRRLGRTHRSALHDAGVASALDSGQQDTTDAALRQGAHARRGDAPRNVRTRLDRCPAGHMSLIRHLNATTDSKMRALRSIKHGMSSNVPHVTQRRDVSVAVVLTGGSLRTG